MTDHTNPRYDAHCRRHGCPCTHDHPCFRGWIDPDDPTIGTTPCQYCRPHLHRRWLDAMKARLNGYPIEAIHRILREGAGTSQ